MMGVTPDKLETGFGYIHAETNGTLPQQANVCHSPRLRENPTCPPHGAS
jgi:mannose-1-phosphate guanylyltransferase